MMDSTKRKKRYAPLGHWFGLGSSAGVAQQGDEQSGGLSVQWLRAEQHRRGRAGKLSIWSGGTKAG